MILELKNEELYICKVVRMTGDTESPGAWSLMKEEH